MVYCTKCGTKNDEDAKHCSKCGASLRSHGRNAWKNVQRNGEKNLGDAQRSGANSLESVWKRNVLDSPMAAQSLGYSSGYNNTCRNCFYSTGNGRGRERL